MNDSPAPFHKLLIKEELVTQDEIKLEPDDDDDDDYFSENKDEEFGRLTKADFLFDKVNEIIKRIRRSKKGQDVSDFESDLAKLEWKNVEIGKDITIDNEFLVTYKKYVYRDIYSYQSYQSKTRTKISKLKIGAKYGIKHYKCPAHDCSAAIVVKFGSVENDAKLIEKSSPHTCGAPVKILNLFTNDCQVIPLEEQLNYEIVQRFPYVKFRGYMHSKTEGISECVKGWLYMCSRYNECLCRGSILFNNHAVVEYRDHFCDDIAGDGDVPKNICSKYPDTVVIAVNKQQTPELFFGGFSYLKSWCKINRSKWKCSQFQNKKCMSYVTIALETTYTNNVCQYKASGIHNCINEILNSDELCLPQTKSEEFSTIKLLDFRSINFEPVPLAEQTCYEPIDQANNPGLDSSYLIFRGYSHLKKCVLVDDTLVFECPDYRLKKCQGMVSFKDNHVISFRSHICKGVQGKESVNLKPGDNSTILLYFNTNKTCKELFYNGFTYWSALKRTRFNDRNLTYSMWLCSRRVETECSALIIVRDHSYIAYVIESGVHTCGIAKEEREN